MLVQVAVACSAWCFFHSLLATSAWDRLLRRLPGRLHLLGRPLYVVFSTVSLAVLMLWIRALPERVLWGWPGAWAVLRWLGLLTAAGLMVAGARAYDNRAFLGLGQMRAWLRGGEAAAAPFSQAGILRHIRHPWYSASLLFFLCCLPVTDVNAIWRGVFIVYTLLGTELEERRLLQELGEPYAAYRRTVPRYWPRLR